MVEDLDSLKPPQETLQEEPVEDLESLKPELPMPRGCMEG